MTNQVSLRYFLETHYSSDLEPGRADADSIKELSKGRKNFKSSFHFIAGVKELNQCARENFSIICRNILHLAHATLHFVHELMQSAHM